MSTLLDRNPLRDVSPEEKAAYGRDGAVVLRQILPHAWIELMADATDRILESPGAAAVEYTEDGRSGRYFGDFFVWLRDSDFERFALESPLPVLAQQIMDARTVNLFYDQLLVKEPSTAEQTPWHQDLPYWPLRGGDIISFWVPFDSVPAEAGAMRYVKGSHVPGLLYAPTAFGKNSGFAELYAAQQLPPLPDMEIVLAESELLVCEVEPGDIVIHHPLALHWSPGNARSDLRRRALAVRYLGDDAVFDARSGTFLENPRIQQLLPEPLIKEDGTRPRGPNFPRAWPPREAVTEP